MPKFLFEKKKEKEKGERPPRELITDHMETVATCRKGQSQYLV